MTTRSSKWSESETSPSVRVNYAYFYVSRGASWEFGISRRISGFRKGFREGFRLRFRNFQKGFSLVFRHDFGISNKGISGFRLRFRDFATDFRISRGSKSWAKLICTRICTGFRKVINPSPAISFFWGGGRKIRRFSAASSNFSVCVDLCYKPIVVKCMYLFYSNTLSFGLALPILNLYTIVDSFISTLIIRNISVLHIVS